ncbi:hypothetical protein UlMin_026882 [Ulmus minor]
MFKNTFQSGFLSVLYSLGSKPLQIWDKEGKFGFLLSNYFWSGQFLFAVTRVKPYICTMPLRMDEGWNQIQFNLADFIRRAYGTNYVETLRVQVHANCRLRIYFSDHLYSEEELPRNSSYTFPCSGFA